MTSAERQSLDVVAVGNAIVDVLTHVEPEWLSDRGLDLNTMNLIDEQRAEELYSLMGPAVEISGGSAANTAVGIASFGGNAAFIGKVRNDQLGQVFAHDIRAAGVAFDTPRIDIGPSTARSFIFVTPDAHRTMATYLGAAGLVAPSDVPEDLVASAAVVYLEGYLWDRPDGIAAFHRAAEIGRDTGTRVALTLSDPFCVERHRKEFVDFVDRHVDVVFANEAELLMLYDTEDLDEGMRQLSKRCEIGAVTRSDKGSVVVAGSELIEVAAVPVDSVVDTTGAGDLYAAGFLYGLSTGEKPQRCGELGSLAAAEVISHLGARPEAPLSSLL